MDRKAKTDRQRRSVTSRKENHIPMVGVEKGKYKVLPLLNIRRRRRGTKGQELGELPFLLVKEPTGKHGFLG